MTILSILLATDTAFSTTAILQRVLYITIEEERVNKDIAARITPQEMIAFKTQTKTGLTLDTKSLVLSRYLSTKPRKGAKVGKLPVHRAYHWLLAVSIRTYILPKVRVSTMSLALIVDLQTALGVDSKMATDGKGTNTTKPSPHRSLHPENGVNLRAVLA